MTTKLLQDLKNTKIGLKPNHVVAAAPAPIQKSTKFTITLYQTDVKKLNEMYSFITSNGRRITASDVVKLALRTAPITHELLKTLDSIRSEDGRSGR